MTANKGADNLVSCSKVKVKNEEGRVTNNNNLYIPQWQLYIPPKVLFKGLVKIVSVCVYVQKLLAKALFSPTWHEKGSIPLVEEHGT